LLVGLGRFKVEEAALQVALIDQLLLIDLSSYALKTLLILLLIKNIRLNLLLFPKRLNKHIGIIILKATKQILSILLNQQRFFSGFLQLCDFLNFNDAFLQNTKHVGNETNVVLTDVETTEVGKTGF
jgi:hypothetical protein